MLTQSIDLTLLDRACHALSGDDVHGVMDELHAGLAGLRLQLSREQWSRFAAGLREHPLHPLLRQSPFTGRAFDKPRGYAGDAELIDLIYGCGPNPAQVTSLGRALYAWEFESSSCRSVRYRRARLAREIDRVASDHDTALVLSIACGHLREVELSVACREGRTRVTALDQDANSVSLAMQEYGVFGVCAYPGSVLDVIKRRLGMRTFHLAYAAGLYDYLDTDLATILTARLFSTLAPGGRLLLANFTPETLDASYMEACMDWRLIYRNEEQMLALLRRVPPLEIDRVEQFRDTDGNITYLRVVRR